MSAAIAKNSPKTARHSVVRPISKIWMLSQECAGLAQAGGLGEAGGGFCKTLALGFYLDVSAFLPSPGRQPDPRIREYQGLPGLATFLAQGRQTRGHGSWYNYLAR